MDGFLRFESIVRHFGSVKAVDGVCLELHKGEIFSLLGPSGCGKTTLLRVAAGFETPDSGRVILDGVDITDMPPNKRRVNTIFQNYALFPHLNLYENIAFGLRVARRPSAEIDREVTKMLHLIQMENMAGKKPGQISGGQKQRVSIARALINRPQVLLLDEPLAALDLKLRQRMLIELDTIHDEVGITFVYVTHDQTEAMAISDRIAVMNEGRIEQLGIPTEIYEKPHSSFVAAFIGDTNFYEGSIGEVSGEYCLVNVEGFGAVECFNDRKLCAGAKTALSVRPEKLAIAREKPATAEHVNVMSGVVDEIIYLGTHTKFWVKVGAHRVAVDRHNSRYWREGAPLSWHEQVWLSWHADDGFMLETFSHKDEALLAMPVQESLSEPAQGASA